MVEVNGVTLIDRMLHQIDQDNVSRIIIVVGYEGKKLIDYIATLNINTPIIFIDNPIYDKTNNIYSLSLAKEYLCEEDTLLCYVGVLMKNNSRATDSLNIWPYYMRGKHSYDKLISNKIIDFIRLIEGCIVLDDYVDGQWRSEEKYKKIEAFIRYPSSESYYGVFVDRVEDEELTRIVFGLTYRELSRLTECYAKAWGIYNEYQHYPRVTRSIRSANLCDITGAWIPEKFPYITFAESGFAFSHVSLWGFYRYVQLMMNNDVHSPFGQLLIKM